MQKSSRVLIVGGYGVVGATISTLLAQRNPDVTVVIAGRSQAKAQRHADTIPGAQAVRIDVMDSDPLAALDPLPTAIVVAVNDHDDRLLHSAVLRGIPLVDIARWGQRVEDVENALEAMEAQAPVVMASGWMASAASSVLAATRHGRPPASQVDIDILFAVKDMAGPDSVTGFLDLHLPFPVREHGIDNTATGLTDPHRVVFSANRTVSTRRLNSPEHLTHPATGLTDGSSVRIAFDSTALNATLTFLVRSGIWRRLPEHTRRGLLYNGKNSSPAPHEVVITTHDSTGVERTTLLDPAGQSHLTAASAVSQTERVLGRHGRVLPQAGISYPEQASDPGLDVVALRAMGVSVSNTGL